VAATPPVTDRAAFQAEVDALRIREKAHTHEGDAIAAARRRLPMTEVDPGSPPPTSAKGARTTRRRSGSCPTCTPGT
jgi:hypothetical protein